MATIICGITMFMLATACRPNEAITRTTEAHIEFRKPSDPNGQPPARILGAIAPDADGQSWFFKLPGSPEELEKHTKAFDEFLNSLQFGVGPNDKPVSWTLPKGWKEGPKKGRYATILIGPDENPLELSVTSFGGTLVENVNRWRAQVSLSAIKPDALDKVTLEVATKQGRKIIRVDFVGVTPERNAMPPFMKQ
jgi:hypothetical protein